MSYNGVLFLQETHSPSQDKIQWKDEFKEKLFFLHRKTNSCSVVIGYTGKKYFKLKKKKMKTVVFLILKAMTDYCVFISINLYNSNIKKRAGFYMRKIEYNAANIC